MEQWKIKDTRTVWIWREKAVLIGEEDTNYWWEATTWGLKNQTEAWICNYEGKKKWRDKFNKIRTERGNANFLYIVNWRWWREWNLTEYRVRGILIDEHTFFFFPSLTSHLHLNIFHVWPNIKCTFLDYLRWPCMTTYFVHSVHYIQFDLNALP